MEFISTRDQISPNGGIKLAIREDCGKCVIKNKMVLMSDGSGGWIEDQVDSGEMEGANTQIYTAFAPHEPFQNLFGILESRI